MDYFSIGIRDRGYGPTRVRLSLDDRRRHMLVSGRSGTGKSTLLANLFAIEANSGRGALLIDPHGELAETALDLVPPRRIRKTIYINPADTEHPVGFNLLDNVPVALRPTRAANIVAAFHSVWHASWGPRLENILYNTIAALLDAGNATLLSVPRMLLNEDYREEIKALIQDPIVAHFWREEFPLYSTKFGAEAMTPVLNKIGQVLSSPVVRNILGQQKSGFDVRHVMDNNYLVVANFSKGLIGEQHANLLGALLISSFGAAAMSRQDQHPSSRKDFTMIVDEFPNYTTTAFASLLSEARKYRLSLVLAHQYLEQMSDEVRAAILGNIGSLIAFRCGAQDAHVFARELALSNPEQVTGTPNYVAWVRLLQGGEPTDAFQLATPPPPRPHGHSEKVLRTSRMHFATPRHKVEATIVRLLSPARSDDEDW